MTSGPSDVTITAVAAGRREQLSHDQQRLDLAWPPDARRNYTLVVRHDMHPVYAELRAFILRILGLVVLISVFATGVTMVVLSPRRISVGVDLSRRGMWWASTKFLLMSPKREQPESM